MSGAIVWHVPPLGDDPGRQSGRTTRSMKAAPPGATYVWCNGALSYPRALARHLGRADLHIVSPWAVLEDRGMRFPTASVVLDHAFLQFAGPAEGHAYDLLRESGRLA